MLPNLKETKLKTREFTNSIIEYLSTQNPTKKYVGEFSTIDIEVNILDYLIIKEKGLFGKDIAEISISQRTGNIDCTTYKPLLISKEKLTELVPIADISKYYFG